MLAERLRAATGFTFPIKAIRGAQDARRAIVLTTSGADATLGAEGYELKASPNSVVIRAPGAGGLLYGTQTLRQLLPPQIESRSRAEGVAWLVPGVRIWDRPRFAYRGFMLDSSRHLQSEAFIRRTLDLMAFHKLNVFHWHLTDDQGWRIEIKKYPRLTSVGAWRNENGHRYGGFFTQAQVRGIVAYAQARNITIVPEIEMPGHSASTIAAYPSLACPEQNGGGNVLCPGDPETFSFLEDVLSEVIALFPSRSIHIGGDEVDKTSWKKCALCQALMRREGLKNEDELQSWFTLRIAAFLKSKGRRLQGWNEIMRGGKLPQDAIVQQWDQPGAAVEAARAGNDVVVSQTGWTYFDYSYDTTPLRKVYEAEPTPAALSPDEARHILGAQAQLWTEVRVDDASADSFIWPRLIALAEVCWSPREARNWDDFERRLNTSHIARLALRGLGEAATSPARVQEMLSDPNNERNLGVQVATWQPEQMSVVTKAVDWDISAFVKAPGAYSIRLRYVSGAHGIAASSLSLLEDGTEIARDEHPSFAGGASSGNTYELKINHIRDGAKYVLRAQLRSDGGTDSHGSVWLKAPDAAG